MLDIRVLQHTVARLAIDASRIPEVFSLVEFMYKGRLNDLGLVHSSGGGRRGSWHVVGVVGLIGSRGVLGAIAVRGPAIGSGIGVGIGIRAVIIRRGGGVCRRGYLHRVAGNRGRHLDGRGGDRDDASTH